MNLAENLRYTRYLIIREARLAHIDEELADDWARRRHDYWPTGNGVGQTPEALNQARQR